MTVPQNSSVPILIETLSRGFFPMLRCHYLVVDFEVPRDRWALRVGETILPFLMLGMAGIVQQPFHGGIFDNPVRIEELFARVEVEEALVTFEDLWLPEFLFESPNTGDVYRVSVPLFLASFSYRDARMSLENFEHSCRELHEQIQLSKEETAAFRVWTEEQWAAAENRPPKNPELQVRKKRDRQ
jgi:hypothetical protein